MELSIQKRDEFVNWIDNSLDDGKSPRAIKDALVKYNVPLRVIEEFTYFLKDKYFSEFKKHIVSDKHTIDSYLLDEINALRRASFNDTEIRNELLLENYRPETVTKALRIVKKRRFYKNFVTSTSVVISFIGLFLYQLMSGLNTEDQGIRLLVTFLPSIASVIFVVFFLEIFKEKASKIILIVPVVMTGIFYYVGTVYNTLPNINMAQASLLNLVISYIFIIAIASMGIGKTTFLEIGDINYRIKNFKMEEKRLGRTLMRPRERLKAIINEININLPKINDIVLSVYSAKNKAAPDVRRMLTISQKHLNELMDLDSDSAPNKYLVRKLLTTLEMYVRNICKREYELLGPSANKLKINIRDEQGRDRIIDVLTHNSTEPVLEYFRTSIDMFMWLSKDLEKERRKI